MYRLPRIFCDSGNADQHISLSFEVVIGINQFKNLFFDASDLFIKEFGKLINAAFDRVHSNRIHSVCFGREVIKKLLASDDQFLHFLESCSHS